MSWLSSSWNWLSDHFSNRDTGYLEDKYSYRDDISIPTYYNPTYKLPILEEDFGGGLTYSEGHNIFEVPKQSWFDRLKSGIGSTSQKGWENVGKLIGSAVSVGQGIFQKDNRTVPFNQSGLPTRRDETPSYRTPQTGISTGSPSGKQTKKISEKNPMDRITGYVPVVVGLGILYLVSKGKG